MLETISTTLNDIQTKLSNTESKYTQQESQLKILEDTIKNLERTGGCQAKTPTHKSRKSPRGLSVSYVLLMQLMLNFYGLRLVYATFMHLYQLKDSIMLVRSK